MKGLPPKGLSFVTLFDGRSSVLHNQVRVAVAFDPNNPPSGAPKKPGQFEAIWDTGATNTVITAEVVRRCRLKPTGMAQVHGVHGTKHVNTY